MSIAVGTSVPRGYEREDVYFYLRPDGTIAFAKCRYRAVDDTKPIRAKTFKYRQQWNGVWVPGKPPGTDTLLFRLPELLSAKAMGHSIWWVEGEKDVNAVRRAGAVATTHHQGAGHSKPEQAEWFRGHSGPVVLAYDLDADDDNGGNPGAACVVRRYDLLTAVGIAPEQISVLRAAKGKDVADHLGSGLDLGAMVPVRDLTSLRVAAARTTRRSLKRYRNGGS